MSKRFEGPTVLVAGAASGIGRACVECFAREAARIVAVDRNAQALDAVIASLEEPAGHAAHALDIRDENAVDALVESVITSHGRIDVLCNTAGIAGGDYSQISGNESATWREILDVNLLDAVNFSRAVSLHMCEHKSGAIVNTASVAGLRSGAGGNAYSASKAAVISLTQTSACDLGSYNVRVNAVCPGLIKTGMTQPVFEYAAAHDKQHKLGSRCELRCFGRPEEIAAAIVFLASDDASYITCQALPVDGGNSSSLNMPGMKH